jgi:hypothetical protein
MLMRARGLLALIFGSGSSPRRGDALLHRAAMRVALLCFALSCAATAAAERPSPPWLGDETPARDRYRRRHEYYRVARPTVEELRAVARQVALDCMGNDASRCRHAAALEHRPRRQRALLARGCHGRVWLACEELGQHYVGLDQAARAVPWLARACRGGLASSCATLAQLHRSGEGLRRSEQRAAEWERRACALEPGRCSPPR